MAARDGKVIQDPSSHELPAHSYILKDFVSELADEFESQSDEELDVYASS